MGRAVVVEFMLGDGECLGGLADSDERSAPAHGSSAFGVTNRRSVSVRNGVDSIAEATDLLVDRRAALVDFDPSGFESLDRCPSLV